MPVPSAICGMTLVMRSVSTGKPEMSVFQGLSFGKIRQPPWVVPGPGVPPPELDVLLVDPLDDPPLDEAPLDPPPDDVELAPPLDEDDAPMPLFSSLPPHATTMATPKTNTTALLRMVRSYSC